MTITLTDKAIAVELRKDDTFSKHEFYRVNDESIMFKVYYDKYPMTVKDCWTVDTYRGDLKDYNWPWSFLCLLSQTKEQDAERIVEKNVYGYRDYIHHGHRDFCNTALESFGTLIESKNIDPLKEYALLIKL